MKKLMFALVVATLVGFCFVPASVQAVDTFGLSWNGIPILVPYHLKVVGEIVPIIKEDRCEWLSFGSLSWRMLSDPTVRERLRELAAVIAAK